MTEVWISLITFAGIYLLYLFLMILRKKSLEKFKKSTEVQYLKKKYQLNLQKISIKKLANIVALANSFIVSLTVFIVSVVENIVLKLLVAMGVMIPLIYTTYYFIGIYYQKRKKDKHV